MNIKDWFSTKSWKTTSMGLLAIGGGLTRLGFAIKAGTLTEEAVMTILTTLITGVGLLFSRDNDKSSETVGADELSKAVKEATSKIPLLLLGALALSPLSCGTTQQERIENAAELCRGIAYNASEVLLIEKPQAEPGLRAAATELRRLETLDQIKMSQILSVISLYPMEQLKSPYARLGVNNGTLILTRLSRGLTQTDLGQADLKPIVVALRQGIELRIGAPK